MKSIAAFLLSVSLFGAIPQDTTTKEFPKQKQLFKFVSDPATYDSDGKAKHSALEPYVPFRIGVMQIAGPKHDNNTPVWCYPKDVFKDGGYRIDLVCDDGSEFVITGIEFPEKN